MSRDLILPVPVVFLLRRVEEGANLGPNLGQAH